jgi:hypothetical protein
MSANTITVTIPDRLYRRLQVVASHTNRPISDILIDSATTLLPVAEADVTLPTELADELAAMRLFSDEALWKATEPTLSPKQQLRLTELTRQQGARTLSPVAQQELNNLLAKYDRSVLLRAQALSLLAIRGHAVPDLNETPSR